MAHGRHATPSYDGLPIAYDCIILLDDRYVPREVPQAVVLPINPDYPEVIFFFAGLCNSSSSSQSSASNASRDVGFAGIGSSLLSATLPLLMSSSSLSRSPSCSTVCLWKTGNKPIYSLQSPAVDVKQIYQIPWPRHMRVGRVSVRRSTVLRWH